MATALSRQLRWRSDWPRTCFATTSRSDPHRAFVSRDAHRAHMARFTHDLMALRPDAAEWGIVGAGLLPADRALQTALAAQDQLYTLIERDGRHGERVTGSARWPDWSHGGLEALSGDRRAGRSIVSLTVTANKLTRLDLATTSTCSMLGERGDRPRPRLAGGYLRRRSGCRVEAFRTPAWSRHYSAFTAMSCDNIQGKRPSAESRGAGVRRATSTRGSATDRRQRHLPQLDGGPDHPGDDANRYRARRRAI